VSQQELGQILTQLRTLTQSAAPPPPPPPSPPAHSQNFPPQAYPSQTQYAAHTLPSFTPSTGVPATYPQPNYQFRPPDHPSIDAPALGPAFTPTTNSSSPNSSIPTASAIDDLFNTLMQAGIVSANNVPVGVGATTTTNEPASTAPTAAERAKATSVDLLKESRRSYRKLILSQKIKLTTADLTKYVVFFFFWTCLLIRSRTQPDIVKLLYTQLPSKCKQCGIRFSNNSLGNRKLEAHLDMHFRQNRKATQNVGRGHSRSWFIELEVCLVHCHSPIPCHI
jgi:pre-mRNA cleavage complex 2 protein Pcf11